MIRPVFTGGSCENWTCFVLRPSPRFVDLQFIVHRKNFGHCGSFVPLIAVFPASSLRVSTSNGSRSMVFSDRRSKK